MTAIGFVLLAIPVLVIVWLIGIYNGLVRLRNRVKNAWSQIDVQLKRRYELIPNLVETVKGYVSHERETLEAVIKARAEATQMQAQLTPEALNDPELMQKFQAVQGDLSSALARLMVVIERYPDLKANENFRDLQAQLEGTENRIAVERRRFNETAQGYNTAVRRFPANVVAGMFGFAKKTYFEAAEGSQTAPKVEF